MAKKSGSTNRDAPADPPVLRVSISKANAQLVDRIEKGNALLKETIATESELESVRAKYYTWDEYNSTLLRQLFTTDELKKEYSYWGIAFAGGPDLLVERIDELHNDISTKLRRLESVTERLPLYADNAERPDQEHQQQMSTGESAQSNSIFVVHGRNSELKETVARYISQLGLEPIILHEQANAGKTLIEKFETHASSRFAVVLLTPDDMGRLAQEPTGELRLRARQNVVFEWGFFVAKLGRRNVCALYAEDTELPSDVDGVTYVQLDRNGAWKMLLAREMKAAGIDVDLNRAI